MRQALPLLLSLAVVGVLEAVYYLARYFQDKQTAELHRRLQSLGRSGQATPGLLRAGKLSTIPLVDEMLRAVPSARRLEHLLEQADLGITVAQLLAYSAVMAVAGFLLGMLPEAGFGLPIGFALVGALVPLLAVLVTRSKRSAKISEQLPDALDMMSRSLRAGHALQDAFQLVASEAPSPINVEFGRAYEEQRLGRTLDQAVLAITTRVPLNPDLKIFAVSVVVQKETGGNLAEILENIAETIRSRYRFYGKLRSLTAEGRTSAVILGALPILMLAFMSVANAAYLRELLVNPLGNWILLYAIVSWMLGLLWMYRMTKVRF